MTKGAFSFNNFKLVILNSFLFTLYDLLISIYLYLLLRNFSVTLNDLYSMKIKEQTRKLTAGCSKHCFEVVDKTDEVSSKHCFEVADRTPYLRQGEADVV
ncbi:chlorohydrolase [Streptococcus pseudopneumoniae 5247]|nr:chlorohydrolase [Streptococcus pseudopneumoniae 5247]